MTKKTSIPLFLLILALMFPAEAMAGAISWLFQVQDFHEIKGGRYVVVLKPLETGKEFPLNCSALTVHAKYDSWRWLFFGGKDMTKEKHKKALLFLEEAFKAQRPVRFGSMGQGFGFQDGTPSSCTVYSRALVIDADEAGRPEIYSYFKWP